MVQSHPGAQATNHSLSPISNDQLPSLRLTGSPPRLESPYQSGQPIPQPPQILLILVGLPGSGKTTFAEALVTVSNGVRAKTTSAGANDTPRSQIPESQTQRSQSQSQSRTQTQVHSESRSHLDSASRLSSDYRAWIRASQDDAPNRRRQECEGRVRWGLREGYNVVVDRVGFDAVQRSHFISIADSHFPRPQVWCLVLSVSRQSLERRIDGRGYHPTIPDLATGIRVLGQMSSQLSPPSTRQGEGEGFDRIYHLQESQQPSLSLTADGIWNAEHLMYVLDTLGRDGQQEVGERRRTAPRQPPAQYRRNGPMSQGRASGSWQGGINNWSRGNYTSGSSFHGSLAGGHREAEDPSHSRGNPASTVSLRESI